MVLETQATKCRVCKIPCNALLGVPFIFTYFSGSVQRQACKNPAGWSGKANGSGLERPYGEKIGFVEGRHVPFSQFAAIIRQVWLEVPTHAATAVAHEKPLGATLAVLLWRRVKAMGKFMCYHSKACATHIPQCRTAVIPTQRIIPHRFRTNPIENFSTVSITVLLPSHSLLASLRCRLLRNASPPLPLCFPDDPASTTAPLVIKYAS
jgi:hypothetical protein